MKPEFRPENAEASSGELDSARLQDFLAIAGEWFWETDTHHRFTFISEKLKEITGVDPASYVGRNRVEMSAEPDSDYVRRHLADLQAQRPFDDYIYQGQTPIGRRWFRVSGRPVFENGRFVGYRGSGIDITEQIDTRDRARQAQSRLELTLKTANEGFAVYDTEDRCIIANERYLDFFDPDRNRVFIGDTFEEIMRRILDAGLVPEAKGDPEQWLARRMEAHRTGGHSSEVMMSTGRWYSISEHKIDSFGTIGVYTDITDRKLRDIELREQSTLMSSIFANLNDALPIIGRAS